MMSPRRSRATDLAAPPITSTLTDIALIVCLSAPAYISLLNTGFFWSHEEAQYLWRLVEFHFNAMNGDFFSRWFPHFALGLGLPVLEYFPSFFLTIAELFRMSGLGFIPSVKSAILLFCFIGPLFTYLLLRGFADRWAGVIGATLFTYAPYRLVNLYVRGDLNEFASMNLLPMNLYLMACMIEAKDRRIRIPLTGLLALSLAASITTHFPSCVIQLPLFMLFIFGLILTGPDRLTKTAASIFSVLTALAMSSPVWLNALLNLRLVQMEKMTQGFAHFADHFILPNQWFSFYWNYGASGRGSGDAISFQLGNLGLIFLLIGLIAIPYLRQPINRKAVFIFLALTILSMTLTTTLSKPLWSKITILQKLQFPYRYLQIPAFCIPALAGLMAGPMCGLDSRWSRRIIILLIILIPIASIHMCRPVRSLELTEQDITVATVGRIRNTHATGEFIPRTAMGKYPPPKPFDGKLERIPKEGYSRSEAEKRLVMMIDRQVRPDRWERDLVPVGGIDVNPASLDVLNGQIKIGSASGPPNGRSYTLIAQKDSLLRYNQFHFPGWKISIDGKPSEITPDPATGLITFSITSGQHSILLHYDNLPSSHILSIVALLAVALHLVVLIRGFGS